MSTPVLTMERLRDPKERVAWAWLAGCAVIAWLFVGLWVVATMGIALVFIGLILLTRFIAENFAAAYIRTNAVQVSEHQLPQVNQLVNEACRKLNFAPPAVYVMQHNLWNAFATKIAGRRMIVLYSGAIDSLLLTGDVPQLAFLIGHELGHHAAGHLDLSTKWVALGGWVPWLYMWYSRRREFTCDRVGLYCAGELETGLAAMCNMTVGAQLAGQVNVTSVMRQWETHRGEFFVGYRTLYSTHPHLLCRITELFKAAGELGIPMRDRATPPPVVGRAENDERFMPPVISK